MTTPAKALIDQHLAALLAIIHKALSTGQHSQAKTDAREALTELEHVVACRVNREIAALGVGATPEEAMRDACSRLWEAALRAAGAATNKKPKWSRGK